jgi:putative polyketide hydroxylase
MVGHPAGAGVFLPTDQTDRWVYATPGESAPTDVVARIRAGAGLPDLPVEVERVGSFTFTAQLAANYRKGRVFLVGDAAHRMTPRGGAGMNTGIADAFALGWRLDWVLRGWAQPSLLDSYEAERRPIGQRATERSAIEGPRDTSRDHLDDLGGRIPHAWVQPGVSTLDLIGAGFTLLTGPAGRPWCAWASCLELPMPLEVRGVSAEAAGALGIGRDGAVLVRPDGVAVATWPSAAGLEAGAPAAFADSVRL